MKIGKFQKFATNLHDKTQYLIHIRILKQALDHWLISKTFHRIIKFNQETWLKPYVDMNRDLRKKKKKLILKNIFLKLIFGALNYGKCEKTQGYQVCNNWSRKELFSLRTKLSYNNFFPENLLVIEMTKTQIHMNKKV